jgi:translocation and assembly module TamB
LKRALILVVEGVTGVVLLSLALTAAVWHWSGTDSSLATVLQRLQSYLPAGQTLEAKDVSGSVRAGGHIGSLRWTHGELSVQADQIAIGWSLEPLLKRQLQLGHLTVDTLTIDDKSAASDSKSLAPPTDLSLPITVDVPFVFHTVRLTGTTGFEAKEVSGHYIFDSSSHILNKGQGTISYGTYQFDGSVQAQAPMALKLQVDGAIQTTLPSSEQPLTVQAHASLAGELAKPDAKLMVQASLQPELPAIRGSKGKAVGAMQAQVMAQVQPWQLQPLVNANAQWQALNLAALWPLAPQTELTGSASVVPDGANWRGQINASNKLPAPWDQSGLPISALKADFQHAQGQWFITALEAQSAGGRLTGQGNFNQGQWQASASVTDINPSALDSRLQAARIQGKLVAKQANAGISFSTELRGTQVPVQPLSGAPTGHRPMDLGTLSLDAQGVWAAPQLKLSALRLEALDAHVQGTLDYQTETQATRADLALSLPGLQGTLNGHLASAEGLGKLTLALTDASQTTRWLQRWPIPKAVRDALPISGTANLNANWQGGWRAQGQQLNLNAGLQAPRLVWASAPPNGQVTQTPSQIRDLHFDAEGTLAALKLNASGSASNGTQELQWHAQANGGRVSAGRWSGALNSLKLGLQTAGNAGTWQVQTDGKPISLDWRQDGTGQSFALGNGSAKLISPLPNDPQAATLSWQATGWSAPIATRLNANTVARWQSQGKLTGLPLGWVDVLGFKSLAELGIDSDMLMDGTWEATQTDSLKLRAVLERSSGDLTIRAGEERQQTQRAGVSLALLKLSVRANEVSASLRWDSARAGQAQLALATRLVNQNGTPVWPDNAPVSGNLQVQMPPIEAWSVLAPPGWRLRGFLDAQATLTGSRSEPHWRGTLQAKDLAVRSVADGIDFQQGSLLARLEGQQLLIDAFTLRGSGKDGGQITLSGAAEWRATAKANASPIDHLDMQLKAVVQALRLSTRSDRRLAVSGTLSADLKDTRLQLRGDLKADRATITLPSENAPNLGDDVVVRPTRAQIAAANNLAPVNVKHPGARVVPEVNIVFDLGPDFQVRGRGLETRLAGKLELLASDGYPPTLTGTVNTVRGNYQAFGQRLNIEQGILRFVGPVDNPVLDILAIRPNLTQRVGVQVIGTVLFPVVRLYAEPDLPEAEKLAWLVMGRSASGSGGEAALLQQAAMALLGGSGQGPTRSLTQALGLDELSFRGATGSTDTASGATITLGKRLSNDFYVAYESGLAGTMGVFSIFYDLSRTLTLRAKTGDQSAVDVIWTRRYD